jgi:hypothetical protein
MQTFSEEKKRDEESRTFSQEKHSEQEDEEEEEMTFKTTDEKPIASNKLTFEELLEQ